MQTSIDVTAILAIVLVALKFLNDIYRSNQTKELRAMSESQNDKTAKQLDIIDTKLDTIDKTVTTTHSYHKDYVVVQRQMSETLVKISTILDFLVERPRL